VSKISVGYVGLAWVLLGAPAPALAQSLPSADSLIQAHVEAMGGREANLAPSSVRTTGIVEMPALGVQGRFEVLQMAPDRMVTRVSVPGVGEITTGFDGTFGWSVNPLIGASLLEGAELDQVRERANVLSPLRDPSLVPERETVERTSFDGQACWRVQLTWASGRRSHDCYSVDTGLLVASEDVQASPMGSLDVTTLVHEYEEHFGMMLPTRLVQSAMSQVQEMVVREITIDDVDPSELAPPAAIQTLIEDAGGR
jgi:hypothetical protein